MCADKDAAEAIFAAGGANVVLQSMKQHGTRSTVMQAACAILQQLVHLHAGTALRVLALLHVIVFFMLRDRAVVIRPRILYANRSVLDRMLCMKTLPLVLGAFRTHGNSPGVVEASGDLLKSLATAEPTIKETIFANSVMDVALGYLAKYLAEPEPVAGALGAIWSALPNDSMRGPCVVFF